MKLSDSLRRFWSLFIASLVAIFGHWSWKQPHWLKLLLARLTLLLQRIKAKPIHSFFVFLLISGFTVAGWLGYQWWQNRPQPVRIDFAVSEPERTAIENDEAPHPLVISFDASVAPLDQVGKDLSQGISITPLINGKWHWNDDKTLEFKPNKDWPIDETFRVKLHKSLIAEPLLLGRHEFEFGTAKFEASLDKSEFFQDQVDPALKKAIFQLRFTHPVDAEILEKKITLKLNDAAGHSRNEKSLKFTISYDKLNLNAYIHSESLPIPRDNQIAELIVAKGIQANNSDAVFNQNLTAKVTVPGKFYGLTINDAQIVVTSNPKTQSQDQVLMVSTSLPIHEKIMAEAIKVWQLPDQNPDSDNDSSEPFQWNTTNVDGAVLAQSQAIEIEPLPTETEYSQLHGFRVHADVNRTLWVKIDKGLESFGGYLLSANFNQAIVVPEYPKELHIMGEGSLLTLSGEKKIALMMRDLAGVKIELGRVLPEQLQHLVSQSDGEFGKPEFNDQFDSDNLSEHFELEIPLPDLEKGKAHYQPVDLSAYLNNQQGQNKRGIFIVKASDYIPPEKTSETVEVADDNDINENTETSDESHVEDQRLIILTDLGIIAKTEKNGDQVVFVQSIQTGQPQVDVDVEIIAKNGLALMHAKTDMEGKVRFPKLSDPEHGRQPVLYLARSQGDMSFLPLNRDDRNLDFSRFDVSGAENAADANQLDAYLFSDRGIYRPGDTLHIGMIVKTSNWSAPLSGLPLEAEILDPRGLVVKSEKMVLAAGGFNELAYNTLESSATGSYSVNLYTIKNNKSDQLLGHVKIKVEEFQADRMKIAARFSEPTTDGWLNPKDLKALINVQNLYGAPAEARKVTAEINLQPVLPGFKRYRDYHFYDPDSTKQSYTETLTPTTTDQSGNAAFALALEKYQGATYKLNLTTQAYEADGGRSVAAEAEVLISDLPFLLGYKSDGALNFIAKDSNRTIELLAIDSKLNKTKAEKLTREILERKVLSVLTKQPDSTYRYESHTKEISLSKNQLTVPESGYSLSLNTAEAGDYSVVVRNSAGLQLARIDYSIAGQGNVSRTLDRNAELQLSLDKIEYAPGDKINVNIRAPYTGSGLITIERDKVYASTWFKADTQATVQSIEIPKDLEGNGYITVQYIRDPGSEEIFMSPLSFGVAPFKLSLAEHQQELTLTVPEHIKPGQILDMTLQSPQASRAVVFAVDEGILQVARYKNPDPLSHFFQKRQLDVDTTQILDLILPEFKKLMQLSAPGGDGEEKNEEDEPAASLLNPFKRKHDKAAVFWSGIVDLNNETVVHYQVPETFNGSLRIMAVSVNDERIANAIKQTQVRDDMIISPNAPFMAAPGDEFTVSVALANHIKGSGDKAPIQLKLSTTPQLHVVDEANKTVVVSEGHEGVASYRIKVKDAQSVTLGNATLDFEAISAGHGVQTHSDLSIRPAIPRISSLRFGSFQSKKEILIVRKLFAQQRKVSAGISPLPLVAVSGLSDYLENFSHNCTEQLVSKAIPAVVLSKFPEFSAEMNFHDDENHWLNLLSILRSRQNAEGGFGLWAATPQSHEFVSIYTLHLLMDALANGKSVPDDMLHLALKYAQNLAASPSNTLEGLRIRAYAAYLLTRQGIVTSTNLASIRESLHNNFKEEQWQQDLITVYLAASYQLLQQQNEAAKLLETPLKQLGTVKEVYEFKGYYDPMIRDAQTLYLLAKHFPDTLKKLPQTFLQNIGKALQENHFNTLSSAYFLMAYQAYSDSVLTEVTRQMAITAIDRMGKQQTLNLPENIAPRAAFSEATQSLRFTGPSNLPLFYAVSESGFDQQLPDKPVNEGLEIQRTFVNAQGNTVDTVKLGEEITVQIRMRAINREWIDNIAIQDLLPAGFEAVLQNANANPETDTDEGESSETDSESIWKDRLSTGGNWHSDYVDVREDRALIYGTLNNSMAEYRYRIKANSKGVFTVPPIFGQSMYESTVKAYSAAGVIKVVD